MAKDEDNNDPSFSEDRSFSSCKPELLKLLSEKGIDLSSDIITSKDRGMKGIMSKLRCQSLPEGFKRWRLPFFFEGEGVNFYISTGIPDTPVARHSHKHGPVVRFVLEGSLIFKRKEFVTADWIFIPEGVEYEFKVGPRGLVSILGYQCCCG